MIWQILEPLSHWIGNTAFAMWLGQSTDRIACIFIFHLFGLTMLLGTTLVMSLRLVGLLMPSQPVAELRRDLSPWNLAGLVLMLLSGGLIFAGGESSYFASAWFRTKMEFLVVALLFHFTVFHTVTRAKEGRFGTLLNKMTGVISLFLWFSVAVSGRAIAYF
jgi:hypothetical protein